MWIVELSFSPDDPERLAGRAAHRDRLISLHQQGVVKMAGPIADDSGAVIVLEAPDRGSLDILLADDPYFAIPGVIITKVREWRPFIA